MSNYKTITLSGAEQQVIISGENCDIRNDSADVIYAASDAGITAGKDGVLPIPAGSAAKLLGCRGKVYLSGTGSVVLCGNDYSEQVFKPAAAAGGADSAARAAIAAHAADSSIHLTSAQASASAAQVFSNPNLLLNSNFSVNQRGVKGTITAQGYFVDRWKLQEGQVTINADGSIYLDGTITQKPENPPAQTVTASSEGGVAAYEATTGIFSITAQGENISWAKLEPGSYATVYVSPDPVGELLKCRRYFASLEYGSVRSLVEISTASGAGAFVPITNMRAVPSVCASDGGDVELYVMAGGSLINPVSVSSAALSALGVVLNLSGDFTSVKYNTGLMRWLPRSTGERWNIWLDAEL